MKKYDVSYVWNPGASFVVGSIDAESFEEAARVCKETKHHDKAILPDDPDVIVVSHFEENDLNDPVQAFMNGIRVFTYETLEPAQ